MSRDYRHRGRHRNGGRQEDTTTVRAPRLSVVDPVPRNRPTAGVVAWAHVDFADGTGGKARPVVVLGSSAHDVEVVPLTTSPKRHGHPEHHVEIDGLDRAGLIEPCGVDLRRVEVERRDLINITGELAGPERQRVLGRVGEVDAAVQQEFADAR